MIRFFKQSQARFVRHGFFYSRHVQYQHSDLHLEYLNKHLKAIIVIILYFAFRNTDAKEVFRCAIKFTHRQYFFLLRLTCLNEGFSLNYPQFLLHKLQGLPELGGI